VKQFPQFQLIYPRARTSTVSHPILSSLAEKSGKTGYHFGQGELVREFLFVLAALTFGYYAGYSWRTYNAREPHHDFLAQMCAPARKSQLTL